LELGSQLAMARTLGNTLSDEQLAELLGLIADADSVDLKLTVPASAIRWRLACSASTLDAQIRQFFFFDRPI
jgi:hypothetical protein